MTNPVPGDFLFRQRARANENLIGPQLYKDALANLRAHKTASPKGPD